MATFQKLNNKVIYTSGNDVYTFGCGMNIFPHPSDENYILISEDDTNQNPQGSFNVPWKSLTTPQAATRNEIILALNSDYFVEKISADDVAALKAKILELLTVTGPVTGQKGLRVFIGPTDVISDIPVVSEFEHHQVHEGESYISLLAIQALSNGNNIDLLIVVPNLANLVSVPHFLYDIDATAEISVTIYEGTTVSANGTEQTVHNRNRNSGNVHQTKIYLTPAITQVGTKIWEELAGDGQAGYQTRGSSELLLKNNTKYLFRLNARNAGCTICGRLKWYEDLGV